MKKVLLIVAIVMVAVMIATVFVGCSAEEYQKQLEKEGYTVSVYKGDKIKDNSVEFMVKGKKDDSSAYVSITKYKTVADAEKARNAEMEDVGGSSLLPWLSATLELAGYDKKVSGEGQIVKVEVSKKDS